MEFADLARLHAYSRRGDISGLDGLIVVTCHAAEHFGQVELTRDLWLQMAAAGRAEERIRAAHPDRHTPSQVRRGTDRAANLTLAARSGALRQR